MRVGAPGEQTAWLVMRSKADAMLEARAIGFVFRVSSGRVRSTGWLMVLCNRHTPCAVFGERHTECAYCFARGGSAQGRGSRVGPPGPNPSTGTASWQNRNSLFEEVIWFGGFRSAAARTDHGQPRAFALTLWRRRPRRRFGPGPFPQALPRACLSFPGESVSMVLRLSQPCGENNRHSFLHPTMYRSRKVYQSGLSL